MKTRFVSVVALCVAVVLAVACTPLRRGVQGDALVSQLRPPVTMRATALPLVSGGVLDAQLYTEVGFATARTHIATYGREDGPRVLTAIAEARDNWQWALDLSVRGQMHAGRVELGGREFAAATFVLGGAKDGFTQDADGLFLVRRFARLDEFRSVKLIVEYREPVKDMNAGSLAFVPDEAVLAAFEDRALRAVDVRFEAGTAEMGAGNKPEGVQGHKLDGFIGRMELKEQLLFKERT